MLGKEVGQRLFRNADNVGSYAAWYVQCAGINIKTNIARLLSQVIIKYC